MTMLFHHAVKSSGDYDHIQTVSTMPPDGYAKMPTAKNIHSFTRQKQVVV